MGLANGEIKTQNKEKRTEKSGENQNVIQDSSFQWNIYNQVFGLAAIVIMQSSVFEQDRRNDRKTNYAHTKKGN